MHALKQLAIGAAFTIAVIVVLKQVAPGTFGPQGQLPI